MKIKHYDKIHEKVYSEKLNNGLSVFVIPKKDFSRKYAFFATNYGGADRRFKVGGEWIDTPEGVAHFLEHKMFDTENGNALVALSANGASPNAYTSSEMTAYYFSCTDNFNENLKTLLSFVSVPYFTSESVAKEQGIIGQEIRMTDDEPEYALYFNLMKCLYSHHPLRYSVAGTVESIAQITENTLYDCHKIFYNPSNMVLCVIGDVDANTVIEIANDILPKSAGEIPARDYGEEESASSSTSSVAVSMDIGMPMFAMGFKCGKVENGTEFLKTDLIASLSLSILAGKSSKLYADLYSHSLVSDSFSAEYETVTDQSHIIISGESNDPQAVSDMLRAEIDRINDNGIDVGYFNRIKKSYHGKLIRSLNSFENTCAGIASTYFKGCSYFDRISVLDAITKDDVEKFIRNNLTPEKFAISIITPNN